jgi:pimeloyl-ACP methyl ester carboxylesterase
MLAEMQGVDALLGGNLNFYSPFYRQCTLQSFVSDSLAATRLTLPTDDVRRAFKYYLSHKNADRPFILAGFSQGAMIALQLLREMDDVTYSRMVAAYIIGASITQEIIDECPHIIPATGSDDTGVTICYNSVREPSCTMWPRSAACINPVNWHTDATPATLITEPSPHIPVGKQQPDTLTITMDPVSNLVLVDGFTATDYILPLIGKDGNYHSREIWLYREQLKENMAERVERFRK